MHFCRPGHEQLACLDLMPLSRVVREDYLLPQVDERGLPGGGGARGGARTAEVGEAAWLARVEGVLDHGESGPTPHLHGWSVAQGSARGGQERATRPGDG